MKRRRFISKSSEWDFELLEKYEKEIAKIAKEFGLDTYPTQIEMITATQMMDVYSAVGMPLGYHHWSFGKEYLIVEKNYRRGLMGIAYEIVINSNPCVAYLLEENSLVMQAIVIAHACFGHNSFFKGNYLFRTWTNPESIIDYLVFARNYISACEERYGINEVEKILDACHSLMHYGVDRYRHPNKLSIQEEQNRQQDRETYLQTLVNDIWRTLPKAANTAPEQDIEKFPSEPQENILYFIEKNAPLLEPWQREIVRIVRKIAQYFYPQRQTKVMNEGWATFWHYTLINELYDKGLVNEQFMLEFLQNHTNVIFQPSFSSPYFNGINPYTLGYNIWLDLKRICESPTEEDKKWFPEIVNTDWCKTLDFAMRNFKDESFIAQYLSPKVIRDMKLFTILNEEKSGDLLVSSIHDDIGYQNIRDVLSAQFNLSVNEPNIQVHNVDLRGDRSLTLRHIIQNDQPLSFDTIPVLNYLHSLWGFPVRLESVNSEGKVVKVYTFPENDGGKS